MSYDYDGYDNGGHDESGSWDSDFDSSLSEDYSSSDFVNQLDLVDINLTDYYLSDDSITIDEKSIYGSNDYLNYNLNNDFNFNANLETKEFQNKTNFAERALAYACEQYDKMINGPLSSMRDMTTGVSGACKMVEARIEMINLNNKTEGWDKYFHCMGNCNASNYGVDGVKAALVIDTMKEMKDVFKYGVCDSIEDFKANFQGIQGGIQGERCYDVCNDRIPNSYNK